MSPPDDRPARPPPGSPPMPPPERRFPDEPRGPRRPSIPFAVKGAAALVLGGLIFSALLYNACVLEIPSGYQAVLIRKTGLDLKPEMELAPPPGPDGHYYKGVQAGVLTEGRYFYNPVYWTWEVKEQFEV